MRNLVLIALALLAGCASAHKEEVAVVVGNALSEPLSCHVTLAHFVTQPSHQVPPGGQLAIAFHRDPDDGTLQVPRAAGEPMAVEALLCGLAEDWSATWSRVPLSRLRDGTTKAQGVVCRLDGRLVCAEES